MADAFRIAFEQQLMQRKDQALKFTQVNKLCKKETKFINWKRLKEDGNYACCMIVCMCLYLVYLVGKKRSNLMNCACMGVLSLLHMHSWSF